MNNKKGLFVVHLLLISCLSVLTSYAQDIKWQNELNEIKTSISNAKSFKDREGIELKVKIFLSNKPTQIVLEPSVLQVVYPYLNDIYSPAYNYVIQNQNKIDNTYKLEVIQKIKFRLFNEVGLYIYPDKMMIYKNICSTKRDIIERILKESGFSQSAEIYLKLLIRDDIESKEFNGILEKTDILLKIKNGSIEQDYFRKIYSYILNNSADSIIISRAFAQLLHIANENMDESVNLYDLMAICCSKLNKEDSIKVYIEEFKKRELITNKLENPLAAILNK